MTLPITDGVDIAQQRVDVRAGHLPVGRTTGPRARGVEGPRMLRPQVDLATACVEEHDFLPLSPHYQPFRVLKRIWAGLVRVLSSAFVRAMARSSSFTLRYVTERPLAWVTSFTPLARAFSKASRARSLLNEFDTRHPTILRENTSVTKATYTKPAKVATYVMSATQSWFGRSALK